MSYGDFIGVRLMTTDKMQIELAAEIRGYSISEFVRRASIAAARKAVRDNDLREMYREEVEYGQ